MHNSAGASDQSEYAVAAQINTAHTGNVDFAAGFAPPLTRVWTSDIGEGLVSYPLIADNRVVVNGDANGDIFALDLATGKQAWKHSLPGSEQGVYDRGRLFFLGESGLLTALSAKTGEQLWSVQLAGETYFPAPPIAADGRVFASGSGSNGLAYSLREKDGRLEWSRYIAAAGFPSLADGGLFLTSGCDYYRLSPVDGSQIWTTGQCVGGGAQVSAYSNGRLYVSGIPTGNIVDGSDGKLLGTSPPQQSEAAFFTSGGKFFGLSLNSNDVLRCWNAKTGGGAWHFTDLSDGATPPVVVNGVVYFGTAQGAVYALSEETGKPVWSDNVGSPSAPTLSAGQGTLIAMAGGQVIAYRPQ